MAHTGSCHCGKVAFDVDGEPDSALACNCSMCHRRGSLLWFVPRDALRLRTPEADAASYTFNRHVIVHRFCATCGIHTHGEGVDGNGNRVAAINLRCIDGIALDTIPVTHYDGRAL
ncbi:GFA family protein [Chiayiivirga flava]|uniref:CENP-V/GFA domain-containing protein n=1 Tax=Chiayiivirga flava TaxID=659595 RepID=A0A7W8D5P5_9GAMM|nr:GFA family protein [Chiayiivirga flava]MBB5208017.1 hypothetical protein [Chiayiivirga flava]